MILKDCAQRLVPNALRSHSILKEFETRSQMPIKSLQGILTGTHTQSKDLDSTTKYRQINV